MDNANKKYEVFISSTYEDLKEERNAVAESLLDMGCCFPAGMERFPASSLSQWDYIKRRIDNCDYYVLIVAGRYGTLVADEKISYTEKEYNYAESKNIPIISFIYDKIENLPNKFVDKRLSRINDFRKRASAGRLVKFYSSVDELRSMVKDALYSEIQNTPRPGWIRADKLNDIQVSETNSQNSAISKEEFKTMFDQEFEKHIATEEDVKAIWNEVFEQELSKEAKRLLIEASKDVHGCFWVIEVDNGTLISVNNTKMNAETSGKEVAIWKNAVKELLQNELAVLESNSSEKYSVTPKGYDMAKQLISSI